MSDLKVYIAQVQQFWEDVEKNHQHLNQMIKNCNPDAGSLFILPEMFNTSFTTDPERNFQEWDDSISIEWLKEKSLAYDIAITTSLIIKESEHYYNRLVFIVNGQIVDHYNKNYLFSLAGEDQKFTCGERKTVINYKGWKIAPFICYDLRFPELARINVKEASSQYDLLLYVANWPEKRIKHWDKLLDARAIENLTYCIGVNRVGEDGNQIKYNGHSKIVDPLGETLLDFQDFEEGIQSVVLRKSEIENVRQRFGFLNDIK